MTFSPDELPPLDRDIAQLLANAERAPPSPVALRLRHHIRRRVGATLAGGALVSATVGVTAGTTSAAVADAAVASAGKSLGLVPLLLGKAKLALVVLGCASAGAVGYGYVKRGHEPTQAHRQHVTAPPVTHGVIAEPKLPEVPPAVALQQRPHVAVAVQTKATPRARATDALLDEQRLLARARAALADGQSTQALAYLQRHAVMYPRGKLGEEREAMAVRVLVRLGRLSQARERARAFLVKYPQSIQRPVVEGTLRAQE